MGYLSGIPKMMRMIAVTKRETGNGHGNLLSVIRTFAPVFTKWVFTTRRVVRQDVAGIHADFTPAVSGKSGGPPALQAWAG